MQEIAKQSGKLKAVVVRSLEDLANYADEWNQLTLKFPQQLPMSSHAWVASYVEHMLEPEESWLCGLAFEDSRLVGVLPLVTTPRSPLGLKRCSLRTPFNLHTLSVDFLAERGRETEIISFLLATANQSAAGTYSIELLRIPESSPTLEAFRRGACRTRFVIEFNGTGAYLRTTGDFGKYRSGLRRKFRRNLRASNRKLSALSGFETVFLTGKDASEKQLDRFMAIEASGWKGQAKTAIKLSPLLVSFYTSLTRRLGSAGWLEWHFLNVEEKSIAGLLAVKFGQSVIALKIAYNQDYALYSPSTVLFERTIERAFSSDEIERFDCLSDVTWLESWEMEKENYYDIFIYPDRLFPVVCGFAPRRFKHFLRRIPGLKRFAAGVRGLFRTARSNITADRDSPK